MSIHHQNLVGRLNVYRILTIAVAIQSVFHGFAGACPHHEQTCQGRHGQMQATAELHCDDVSNHDCRPLVLSDTTDAPCHDHLPGNCVSCVLMAPENVLDAEYQLPDFKHGEWGKSENHSVNSRTNSAVGSKRPFTISLRSHLIVGVLLI